MIKAYRRHITLILFSLMFYYNISGQQIPVYSQFFMNKYVNNPAFAGVGDKFSVSSNHRYQWVGITDAPRTYTLSIDGPTKKSNNGLGAFLYTDHVGPTRRTGIQASYSYLLKINSKIKLSLSLSAGLLEWKIDGHKLNLINQSDPALLNNVLRDIVPDAKFGFIMFSNNWHFGASAANLLQNEISFSSSTNSNGNKLEDHYTVHGGYIFNLNNDIEIDPYLLVRLVSPAPIQMEFGTKFSWKNTIWAGFTFRSANNVENFSGDAASLLIGYTHQNNLSFGYAYDFTTSNLGAYSSGTHELLFRILFNRE